MLFGDYILFCPLVSLDAGVTVHNDDVIASRLMVQAATTINVKPHVVGSGAGAKLIYGPCDIEVHRGSDGRYYVVDAARLLPPEPQAGSLSAFLIHATPTSGSLGISGRISHLTSVDLSRDGAEEEIARVLSTSSVLGVDAAANAAAASDNGRSDSAAGLIRVTIPGATVYLRADANPAKSGRHAVSSSEAASLGVLFGRNVVAEAFLASVVLASADIATPASSTVYGDAVIVTGERGQHLFNCLRPEFVRDWPVPLSSDAFTRFGLHDAAKHNAEVRAATKSLQLVHLPAFSGLLFHTHRLLLNPRAVIEQVFRLHYKYPEFNSIDETLRYSLPFPCFS